MYCQTYGLMKNQSKKTRASTRRLCSLGTKQVKHSIRDQQGTDQGPVGRDGSGSESVLRS